jgi:hypothetical protein
MSGGHAPAIEDVLAVVRCIADPARGPEALEAEAWRIVRRARLARAHRAVTGRAHPDHGDGSLGAAAWGLRREGAGARPTSLALLRAGAAVCRVLAGDAPEPQEAGRDPGAGAAMLTGGAASKDRTLRS